jgi:hypothetical protein
MSGSAVAYSGSPAVAQWYSLNHIAAALGCNVNTIKSRVHRARLHFREALCRVIARGRAFRETTLSNLDCAVLDSFPLSVVERSSVHTETIAVTDVDEPRMRQEQR